MTTFYALRSLDKVLWTDNHQAGIIAQTLDDTSRIFRDKLKYAFDNLDPRLRPFFKIVSDSTKELAFSHGSSIRVGTSLRSSTLQDLHISEFGKICAKDPERAREVVTGALNTVHAGQNIVIESTAEGREGYFYDMCQRAESLIGKPLGPMDYKFRFFPWWKHPDYIYSEKVDIPERFREYFDKLHLRDIKLTEEQQYWYVKKAETQQEDMTREYPSFPEEAFSASQDGFWYASIIKELYNTGHITNISYDRGLLVHTAFDLGQADHQIIWFFQITKHGDLNIIDFWKGKDTNIALTVQILKDKGYSYGTHIWPHDANSRDRAGITFVQQASALGLSGMVLDQSGLVDGIRLVRTTLGKCWFDVTKCRDGINDLQNYKKRWNSAIGGWTNEPIHDDASHAADAFRYLAQGYGKIDSSNLSDMSKALRGFWG
jgi:hypothetical protein